MKYTPHAFQKAAIVHAASFLRNAQRNDRILYYAPTGSGKSVMELAVQEQLPNCWIITPREEIAAGMLDKLETADTMEQRCIMTPVRMRNRLLDGRIAPPNYVLYDEGHHSSAETWQQLNLLTGLAPCAAFTATPYRGTPRSTREFLEYWGDPVQIISFKEACDNKYISCPTFEILPLVDDDIVEVQGGDFSITSLNGVTVDRLEDMAEHATRWYDGKWDRPTVFAMPSSETCRQLQKHLLRRGVPAFVVSADTPRQDRQLAFRALVDRVACVLHINIISEGFDAPIRRLVDMAPTLSPVKWVQQLGRCTRPTDKPPEYICSNRNVWRHAYALEGAVPIAAIVETERAFGPTTRVHTRALGLEAIGRFKPAAVKMLNGSTVYIYSLSTLVGTVAVEYCVLVPPTKDPVWTVKINTITAGVKTYGNWTLCEAPKDLVGFSSVSPSPMSEKQRKWWDMCAASYGLDPKQDVTRKNFQAMPVLKDTGVNLL